MHELFINWKKNTTQFMRIQWVYAVAAVVLLLVGGVAGLINFRVGINLAALSGYAGIIFVVNFVINAIIVGTFGAASTSAKPRQTRR